MYKRQLLSAAGAMVLALPVALGYNVLSGFTLLGFNMLDFFDFVSNSVLMPVAAFLTCIFITRVVGIETVLDEVKLSSPFKRQRSFTIILRYVAPVCTLAIFVSQLLSSLGVISI